MSFPPMGNSDHVVVSVSIDFPINSKQDTPFHRVAYDYSRADWGGLHNHLRDVHRVAYDYYRADWGGLHDHLRDVLWEDIFKLSASAAASEFCEPVQVGIDVYIPHSSPWFSAACAAAIVHRNHFFRLYQQNKSSESKVKFRQASNRCKGVLEAAKLAYAIKTRVHHFPETSSFHLNWLNWFHFLILEGGLLIILIDCMIFLSPFLDVARISMSTVSFLAQLGSGILYL